MNVDELVGALLQIVLEIAGEFLAELALELAVEALIGLFDGRKKTPVVSYFWLAILGALGGIFSVVMVPYRVTPSVLPGISILLAPFGTGCAMLLVGRLLRRIGRTPSNLATFRGGACFAFAMALVRWRFIGLAR